SQSLLQQVINTLPQAVSVKDTQSRFRMVNEAMVRFHGTTEQAVLGRKVEDLGTYTDAMVQAVRQADEEVLRRGGLIVMPEYWVQRRDAPQICLRMFKAPLHDAAGHISGVLTIAEDITALKEAEARRLELERQIQHAQKLEGLGVLAGGIAHDFNNLLGGILGHAEVAQRELDSREALQAHLQSIHKAGHVAADLVRKMLAYSGKGRLEAQPLDLNALVEEMVELLRVSFPAGVELRQDLMPDLPAVLGDAAQLRQVVMNLITNAVEAIGSGAGRIVISTGTEQLSGGQDQGPSAAADLAPGPYAVLEVADTGCGMTPEVLAHIYEPFFSTKFMGRGLGMAAVQ
ncbi:MAG TPA: PAS domain S-box protein, partial [bacterium]|nr:PAS domain S-box protein [bacterium]